MKFSKFLLILAIIVLLSVFVMNASFAASSEKLKDYKSSTSLITNNKVSTFDSVSKSNPGKGAHYYNISIKKPYQKNYKIKSVTLNYTIYDYTGVVIKRISKNYAVNNKNNHVVYIKVDDDDIMFSGLTVNYQTNGKIKNESIRYSYPKGELKSTSYLTSSKANAKRLLKIHMNLHKNHHILIKYQKIKIVTKNKKYKIKAVKLALYDYDKKIRISKTFKGYGKNRLYINLYFNKIVETIKIYYY